MDQTTRTKEHRKTTWDGPVNQPSDRSLIGCQRVDLIPARSDIFRLGIQKWHREQLSQMTVESVLELEDDLEVKVLTIIDYHSCDGRVVKALDLKSNGVFPRRFEPCSQRIFL